MDRFSAAYFLRVAGSINRIIGMIPPGAVDAPITEKVVQTTFSALENEKRVLEKAGLRSTVAMTSRLMALVKNSPAPTFREFREALGEYHRRLEDDLNSVLFLQLDSREASLYDEPRSGWGSVIESYPSAIRDIEEAGKCLALGRATASVFHLMRVAEHGLRALGKSLNDPGLDPSRNPTWHAILNKCRKEQVKPRHERCQEWQADPMFFDTSTVMLTAVQHAWRNPSLHIERDYTLEEAQEVRDAIRAFMRHLAARLQE